MDWEVPLEEEMATHSSILLWRIPWMEEPGGRQSVGSQRVGRDRATKQQQQLSRRESPPCPAKTACGVLPRPQALEGLRAGRAVCAAGSGVAATSVSDPERRRPLRLQGLQGPRL